MDSTQIVVNIKLIEKAANKYKSIRYVGECFREKLKETPYTYKKWFGLKTIKTTQLKYTKEASYNSFRGTGYWAYMLGFVKDRLIGDAIDVSYKWYGWEDWIKYADSKVLLSESDYSSLRYILDFDLSHLITCLEDSDKE